MSNETHAKPRYTTGHVNMLTRTRHMSRTAHKNQPKHNEKYKKVQLASGIKQIRIMVPERDVEKVKKFAADLRYQWKIDPANEDKHDNS